MGLVISTQRVADNRPARLNRDAFFANGATVDHGDHLHEFAISGEQATVRNLQRQEDGETLVATSERTMSLDAAFAQYEFLLNGANIAEDMVKLAFLMALAEAMEGDDELSDEDRHEAQAVQDSDTEELAAQGSDVDEPAEDDDEEESSTASPTM
jgi:hypothetical protein